MCSYIQPHKNTWNWPLITKFEYWTINTITWDVISTLKGWWWSLSNKMLTDLQFDKFMSPCLPSSPAKSSLKRVRWHHLPYKEESQVGHPLCVMTTRITHTSRWFSLHVNWSQLYLNKTIIIFPTTNQWEFM